MFHMLQNKILKVTSPLYHKSSSQFCLKNNEISSIFYSFQNLCTNQLEFPNKKSFIRPRQIWLENLDTVEEKKLDLIALHPEVFATQPRTDIIHENLLWQRLYKFVVN